MYGHNQEQQHNISDECLFIKAARPAYDTILQHDFRGLEGSGTAAKSHWPENKSSINHILSQSSSEKLD